MKGARMTTEDTYEISAKYYDGAYEANEELDDVPFYVELAGRKGPSVLEIACGTGRVLRPTARSHPRLELHGLDNSRPMLDLLRRQLEREPHDIRKRVVVHQGDMRSFSLGRTFSLVTIPFRPLQHMYTVEDSDRLFAAQRTT
jgi:SAM-dependent methyltransferase